MKKHKFKKPQLRRKQKPTTGKLEFVNVVYMDKEKIDGVDVIYATCTCDKWRTSPEATTITKVAHEAKQHCEDSGHQFRKHDDD